MSETTTVIHKRSDIPLQKLYKDSDKKYHLAAYISSTLRDRDGDRFSKAVLEEWAKRINNGKINLGQDHGSSWKDTMGVWYKSEVRQNPHGDDINQAKNYLFADAILEDPEVNKDVSLLIHKNEIGEQVSLSIAANPADKNWYDLETEKDGSNTRVIKSAELLKADVVGEPANPDARSLGVFLKHDKRDMGKCEDNCSACYVEKDFNKCIQKSLRTQKIHKHIINGEITKDCDCDCPKLPDNHRHTFYLEDGTLIYTTPPVFYAPRAEYNSVIVPEDVDPYQEPDKVIVGDPKPDKPKPLEVRVVNGKSISSLVNENMNKTQMTLSKEEQDKLNKEHGCKEGEVYCDKEGKCMPDESKKSKLSPTVEKYIEILRALATTPAPLEDNDVDTDKYGDNNAAGLESIVQQALASMRAVPAQGQFNPAIPVAQISVTPGTSGQSGVQPQAGTQPVAPNIATGVPIPPVNVQATPGVSGVSGVQPQAGSTPATPEIANPAPLPVAQVQASVKEPEIKKEHIRTLLLDEQRIKDYFEKARENVTPKQENPGEILPIVIDTSKISEAELKKAAEEYNKKVYDIHAAQVRQQYTPNDLVKMSEEGKLVKSLDENNNFDKTVKAIAKSNKSNNKVVGSLLLTKAA